MTIVRRSFAAVACAVALAGAVGCAGTPLGPVLRVPGTYTADVSGPSLDGTRSAKVALCVDSPTAVRLEGPQVGSIRLTFAGVQYVQATGNADPLVTPVLQPGCGELVIAPTRAGFWEITSLTITASAA